MTLQELQEIIAKNKQSRIRKLGVWRTRNVYIIEPLIRQHYTYELPFIYVEKDAEVTRADDATVLEILHYFNNK